MKKIAIEDVTAGTKLIRPVTNDSGITLFGEGTILDDRAIERIKALGIDYIYIEGAMPPRRPIEEELEELERRFSKVSNVPYMTTIKTVIKEYIVSLYKDASEDECKPDKE